MWLKKSSAEHSTVKTSQSKDNDLPILRVSLRVPSDDGDQGVRHVDISWNVKLLDENELPVSADGTGCSHTGAAETGIKPIMEIVDSIDARATSALPPSARVWPIRQYHATGVGGFSKHDELSG